MLANDDTLRCDCCHRTGHGSKSVGNWDEGWVYVAMSAGSADMVHGFLCTKCVRDDTVRTVPVTLGGGG